MTRITFNRGAAAFMLFSGVGMAAAGFIVPPTGEISPSVLMFTAQALVFAGSAMGIDVLIDHKIMKMKKEDGKL